MINNQITLHTLVPQFFTLHDSVSAELMFFYTTRFGFLHVVKDRDSARRRGPHHTDQS